MKKNNYVDDKFSNLKNPKDGYLINDCVDAQMRRFLKFAISILNPKKSTSVLITTRNTIFGTLEENA